MEEFGGGDLNGREQAESKESARSIFPVLTSFNDESNATAIEGVGIPFDAGEMVADEDLDACEA
jgi:hypothetical protein